MSEMLVDPKAGLTQILSLVLGAHPSLVTDKYFKECTRPGKRICKTPDVRLNMLPTAIIEPTNING